MWACDIQSRLVIMVTFAVIAFPLAEETTYIDNTTSYCYQSLIANASCCRDLRLSTDVSNVDVHRPGTSWDCISPRDGGHCLDEKTGPRGKDKLWWPVGANCSSPRILYVHGGNWKYHGPTTASYDVLASKLAQASGAVVLVPDYRLIPIGNYSDILRSLLLAWRWLAIHGPEAKTCESKQQPPLFVGGDSSGGGTGLSLVLRLQVLKGVAATASPAGYFGFSPWTNLQCNTPTYYGNAFAAFTDLGGKTDYVGDILNREVPRKNTAAFQKIALSYVGGVSEMLQDPVASPFFATEELLRSMPPLYFAVSGTEVMAGDSMVIAGQTAKQGVLVAQDIFPGMWHSFPLYSEGCGSGAELWQGKVVLEHTGDFVRQIAKLAKDRPELIYRKGLVVGGASTPQTNIHLPHPTKSHPWISVMPLSFVSVLPERMQKEHASLQEVPVRKPKFHPKSRVLPEDVERGGCTAATLAGAYLTGAAGGFILFALGLAISWWYLQQQTPVEKQHTIPLEKQRSPIDPSIQYELVSLGSASVSRHTNGQGTLGTPMDSTMGFSDEPEIPRWTPRRQEQIRDDSRERLIKRETPSAFDNWWPWHDAICCRPKPEFGGARRRQQQEEETSRAKKPIMRDMRAEEILNREEALAASSFKATPNTSHTARSSPMTSYKKVDQSAMWTPSY